MRPHDLHKLQYASPASVRPLSVLRILIGLAALAVGLVSIAVFGIGGGVSVMVLASWTSTAFIGPAILAAAFAFVGFVMIFVSVRWFEWAFQSETRDQGE